jgi:hypothetical protein
LSALHSGLHCITKSISSKTVHKYYRAPLRILCASNRNNKGTKC